MRIKRSINRAVMRLVFPRWSRLGGTTDFGYSLIVPVPGDLPVFTLLALDVISKQDATFLNEIILIPDRATQRIREISSHYRKEILTNLELVEFKWLHRLLGQISKNPNTYHFIQLFSGINVAKSSHVLLHDADLFLNKGSFFRDRFDVCIEKKASVFGVHPRKRKYTNDCQHLVATWEMFASMEWLRRFKPYQHKGQVATFSGKQYGFDTMHLTQYLSDPNEILYDRGNAPLVHFNYLISTFRHYENASKPYNDIWFKLLLIRLLIDAYGDDEYDYSVPTYKDCLEGIHGKNRLVNFKDSDTEGYRDFRKKLALLANMDCLKSGMGNRLLRLVEPFDSAFL